MRTGGLRPVIEGERALFWAKDFRTIIPVPMRIPEPDDRLISARW